MLVEKDRLVLDVPVETYLDKLVAALALHMLPKTSRVASLAQSGRFPHKNPADRLIGASALALDAPFVTRDREFREIAGLQLIW